jgi:hypothetical protein
MTPAILRKILSFNVQWPYKKEQNELKQVEFMIRAKTIEPGDEHLNSGASYAIQAGSPIEPDQLCYGFTVRNQIGATGPFELNYSNGYRPNVNGCMTLLQSTGEWSDDKTPDQITVLVGVHGMAKGLPSSGRLLVVEAEPEKAKEIRNVLRERPEALVCEEVLSAENDAMVQWHLFNDARFSGPSELTEFKKRYPNLRQINEELRRGRSLADLLDNWAPRQGEQALSQLHLILRQGDPLATLAGLGTWLSQLETVQLMLPWPEGTMGLVETWLKEKSFRQDTHTPTLWKLDPIMKRDWLLNEKDKEKQYLLDANQQLNIDCEALKAEKDFLLEKVKMITAKLERLIETQDLTVADFHQSQAKTEKLRLQQEALQHECQQLAKDKSELLQKLEAAESSVLNSTEALRSIFPMNLYREKNIDLNEYDENKLLLHYIQHGRHEGRLKTYQDLNTEWKSSLRQCEEAETKLEQLETQFGLVQIQLETVKDLFARLADRQESQHQDKKE